MRPRTEGLAISDSNIVAPPTKDSETNWVYVQSKMACRLVQKKTFSQEHKYKAACKKLRFH